MMRNTTTQKTLMYGLCLLVLVHTTSHARANDDTNLLHTVTDLEPNMVNAMIEVRAARIEPDRFLPWRNSVPRWHTGYGVAVQPGIFLTSETLIRNHAAIQIRRAGSVQPMPAEVVLADPRVGLALIRASEENGFPEATPLPILDSIPPNGDFVIVQWGANDHIQTGIGNLLSIGFESVGEGIPPQLTYELASPLRVSQTGTPILYDGKLAGLAMQFEAGRRAALIVSPDSISRFLTATAQENYSGVPEPDFQAIPLADPVHRRFLGVPNSFADRGIYIHTVAHANIPQHDLQINDVLLRWDGHELDASGNYEHPDYGRIPFAHLVAQRAAGDHVEATIVRDKTVQTIEVRLRANAEVFEPIPENAIGQPDDYIVAAGLVFRELTLDFLRAHGDRWQRRAEIDLTWHAYAAETNETHQRTVILVGVLADPINIGYRDIRNQIVQRVNGHPIAHLADLADRLDQGGFRSVTFASMPSVPLVFAPQEVELADQRIQQRFQIPALRRLSQPQR